MRKGWAAIWSLAVIAGLFGGAPEAEPGDAAKGKVLVPPAADFTSAASRKKSDAELLAIIENGRPPQAMTAWKDQLTAREIQDVLAYVKTLRKSS